MEAVELKMPDGTAAGVFRCGKCKRLYESDTPDIAERCCRPYVCTECGQEVAKPHRMVHDGCLAAKRVRDGVLLESWDGWVFVDYDVPPWSWMRDGNPGWAGGYDGYVGDGYFESVEYARKALSEMKQEAVEVESERNPYPAYVHPCEETPFHVDADTVLKRATEELYEDALDDVSGKAEFYAAVDALNKANVHLIGYSPMYGKHIRLDAPKEQHET